MWEGAGPHADASFHLDPPRRVSAVAADELTPTPSPMGALLLWLNHAVSLI